MKTDYKVFLDGSYVRDLPHEVGTFELKHLCIEYNAQFKGMVVKTSYSLFTRHKEVVYQFERVASRGSG